MLSKNTEIVALLDDFSLNINPLNIELKENRDWGWICDMCNKHLRYKEKFYHKPTIDDSIDYCEKCYLEIDDEMNFIDTENEDLYLIRSTKISIISLAIVPERKIDPLIKLSKEGTQEWLNLIPKLYYIPNNFGSLRKWAAITNFQEIPFIPVDIIILIDTVENRIATGLINKYGYLSLYIVYDNIESYLNDKETWEKNKPSQEKYSETLKRVRSDLKEYECTKEDLLILLKTLKPH
jgi:hypothetical protein